MVVSFVSLAAFHQAFAQSSNTRSSDFNFNDISFSIWLSEGKTTLGHHTSIARNHPTSILENEDQTWFLDITRKKRFYRGKNVLDARFNFGISFFDESATFDDKDFCSGPPSFRQLSITDCGNLTLWSHTISYGNLSASYFFGDIFANPRKIERTWFKKPVLIQITPFFGAGVILEDYIYRDTLVLVDLDAVNPTTPGTFFRLRRPIIRHDISWSVARWGGEIMIKPKDKAVKNWTARFEASLVPLGHFRNEDSHFFRSDLGPVPNIIDESSTVNGYQFSADIEYRPRRYQKTAFFIGYRLDDLSATGTSSFGPDFDNFSPADFTRKRSGVVLGFRNRF